MARQDEAWAEALGRVVSGCFVLTVHDGPNHPLGMLLSFVQQVGFEPPLLAAAVRKDRTLVPTLDREGLFVLNICARDDKSLFQRFAKAPEDRSAMFEGLETERVIEGIILKASAAYLQCSIVEKVDSGDHWLYIAEVQGGATCGARASYVHIRKSGLNY